MHYSGGFSKGGTPGQCWCRLCKRLCLACILICLAGCNQQDMENSCSFYIEEGLARDTLKEAARQADVEFIYSSDLVRDLYTPALKGRYTPSEAFEILLADSSFIVVQHERSGVYSIQRMSLPESEIPQLDQQTKHDKLP